jgi:hypothetical protein
VKVSKKDQTALLPWKGLHEEDWSGSGHGGKETEACSSRELNPARLSVTSRFPD